MEREKLTIKELFLMVKRINKLSANLGFKYKVDFTYRNHTTTFSSYNGFVKWINVFLLKEVSRQILQTTIEQDLPSRVRYIGKMDSSKNGKFSLTLTREGKFRGVVEREAK